RVIDAARAALGSPRQAQIVDCGEFSLAELRALLDRASLFIGGDSGPLHVAATSDVAVVGLYGPTLPARSAPWRPPTVLAEAADRAEQLGTLALFGMAGAVLFSIAIAQILLAAAVACWAILVAVRHERVEVPAFFWPLAAYAGITLVSAAFSLEPRVSFVDCK